MCNHDPNDMMHIHSNNPETKQHRHQCCATWAYMARQMNTCNMIYKRVPTVPRRPSAIIIRIGKPSILHASLCIVILHVILPVLFLHLKAWEPIVPIVHRHCLHKSKCLNFFGLLCEFLAGFNVSQYCTSDNLQHSLVWPRQTMQSNGCLYALQPILNKELSMDLYRHLYASACLELQTDARKTDTYRTSISHYQPQRAIHKTSYPTHAAVQDLPCIINDHYSRSINRWQRQI